MKVLMFGWEFPPFKSGGLGTACFDLTKGLNNQGVEVTFVMPTAPDGAKSDFVKLVAADKLSRTKKIKIRKINTILTPYMTSESYDDAIHHHTEKITGTKGSKEVYGDNLHEEVYRYSEVAKAIAEDEEYDLIHAHDWMTYQAGINAREISGKPLVVHIHATEYDRTGGNPNPYIAELEYKGMSEADMVIANSEFTKNNVIEAYDIDPEKIKVVHWGIDPHDEKYKTNHTSAISKKDKLVLFLGRITIQKGPEYFVRAAKLVADHVPNVKFVMAGSGDMANKMIEEANHLGLADKILFAGWLKGNDSHKAFQMADLYVMPSVSEPFGLVALESMANGTPVLISKQSGASEVIQNALKVNFWDVAGMADKMIGVLKHSVLHEELSENSYKEVMSFSLDEPARKTIDCYEQALGGERK